LGDGQITIKIVSTAERDAFMAKSHNTLVGGKAVISDEAEDTDSMSADTKKNNAKSGKASPAKDGKNDKDDKADKANKDDKTNKADKGDKAGAVSSREDRTVTVDILKRALARQQYSGM
jgi:ABC-type Zn2+ transport system substrate-binding protein/surface adhesin